MALLAAHAGRRGEVYFSRSVSDARSLIVFELYRAGTGSNPDSGRYTVVLTVRAFPAFVRLLLAREHAREEDTCAVDHALSECLIF